MMMLQRIKINQDRIVVLVDGLGQVGKLNQHIQQDYFVVS